MIKSYRKSNLLLLLFWSLFLRDDLSPQKSYIYLEFLGADNLIPMELALKIASKIRAKERFAVYVIIPMWPEGVPSSASVQEILFWQVM